MRSLAHARRQGREYRDLLASASSELCDRVTQHLWSEFGVEAIALSEEQMGGSAAEVSPSTGILKYNRDLPLDARTVVFAHELGHLVLHRRLTNPLAPPDPILGSAYADAGSGAIARYSPRAAEEAEATAFALELLCPSDVALADWLADPTATSMTIAEKFAVPVNVARSQLAQGLYDRVLGHPSADVKPLSSLSYTSRQLEAAKVTGKPALIDAGPGTGKTATLVARLRFLLNERGARPDECLILTFSNEAAEELRNRLAVALGADAAAAMTIATFHGFGMTFLHHHGQHVGYGTDFSILDEDAQLELVSDLLGRVPCDRLLTLRDPSLTAKQVVDHINFCKHRLHTTDALEQELAKWRSMGTATELALADELLGIYRAYEEEKHRRRCVDFADLIMLPLMILEGQGQVAEAYRVKYPWVLVDEFQDVTRATATLLSRLCSDRNPPWVVGDARQAIYRFLGAAPENVSQFAADFPGAAVFELEDNYRSAGPVVAAANTLATLMLAIEDEAAPAAEGPKDDRMKMRERWRPAGSHQPLGDEPIVVARATSDHAEREGIADRVAAWLSTGEVAPGDIAVLARRNLDVRNTVLALAARGIRAQASGLLTAEGAAGDLAAVLSAADGSRAALPRLAWALRGSSDSAADVNAAVRRLLDPNDPPQSPLPARVEALIDRVRRLQKQVASERITADGFSTTTIALFDSPDLLRPLFQADADAEAAMALVEIVSTLYLAAGYRFTHRDVLAADARVGFAQRLREQLTEAVSLPLAPQPTPDAVRVMTCHASKGLEFPCVIVAGQTTPKARERYSWLPPYWRPTLDDELAQGDALLFVGATRAQRALVVSYPMQAGEGARGRAKVVARLLASWLRLGTVPIVEWTHQGEVPAEVTMGPLWGGTTPASLRLATLDAESSCPIQVYVEQYLGLRFPEGTRPLYPAFVAITRRLLRRVASLIEAEGKVPNDAQLMSLLVEMWPEKEFADHPHGTLYRNAAARMAREFAGAYGHIGAAATATTLDPKFRLTNEDARPALLLDLIAHARQDSGRVLAVAFRPESLAAKVKNGSLNWSELTTPKRLAFSLLEHRTPGIDPMVFSGVDGQIYPFRWSTKATSLATEVERAQGQLASYASGTFATKVGPFKCDNCSVRVTCPHWLGALT